MGVWLESVMINRSSELVLKKKKKRIMIGYMVPLKAKIAVSSRGRLGKNKASI